MSYRHGRLRPMKSRWRSPPGTGVSFVSTTSRACQGGCRTSFANCRPGYGFGRRTLYKDSEETFYHLMRPVILNGITEIVTRGDLLDRVLSVELPAIVPDKRQSATQLWQAFSEEHPAILGALLDATSMAMGRQKEVATTIGKAPRMAD